VESGKQQLSVPHDGEYMDCLTTRGNGVAIGSGTALQSGRSRVRFQTGSFEIFIDYDSRGESTSDVFWWVKVTGA